MRISYNQAVSVTSVAYREEATSWKVTAFYARGEEVVDTGGGHLMLADSGDFRRSISACSLDKEGRE